VKNPKTDKSMGYAFVEFVDEKSATSALSLDQTEVQERKLNVSKATSTLPDPTSRFISAPSHSPASSSTHFPHKETLTLFVTNLPFSCANDDVLRALPAHLREKVREIRLATDKSSKCKGYGYVEFGDVESMQETLGLESLTVKGRPANLARSDPPKRKGRNEPHAPEPATEPAPETVASSSLTRKPRMSVPIVPRALKMKTLPSHTENDVVAKDNENDTSKGKDKGKATARDSEVSNSSSEQVPASKSNDYFKQLMGKK